MIWLGQEDVIEFPIDRDLAVAALEAATTFESDPAYQFNDCWRELTIRQSAPTQALLRRFEQFLATDDAIILLTDGQVELLEAILECAESVLERTSQERIARIAIASLILGVIGASAGLAALIL